MIKSVKCLQSFKLIDNLLNEGGKEGVIQSPIMRGEG